MRRWNGWGDETFDKPLPKTARSFLQTRLGHGEQPVDTSFDSACVRVPDSRLSAAPGPDVSPEARLRHAHGQSLADWAALRHGDVGPFPDAVAMPATHAEARAVLDDARRRGAVVIPYGGGTSVVGHLQVIDDGRPVISLDTHNRIARLGSVRARRGR